MTDQASSSDQGSKKKPLVLILEDDVLLSKMYSKKFTLEGLEVLVAGDGEEGLRLAIEKNPRVIVLDLMMPKVGGLDFLEKLRKKPQGKDVAVIVLTNLSKQEETERAKKLGVKDILLKANLTPDEVLEKVRRYC